MGTTVSFPIFDPSSQGLFARIMETVTMFGVVAEEFSVCSRKERKKEKYH